MTKEKIIEILEGAKDWNGDVPFEVAVKAINNMAENIPQQPEQTRVFVELVVEYPDPELCTYKEYKGKPYYSIKYIENGKAYVGYGTYNPEVLSQYLKEYFISSAQPDNEDLIETIRNGITASNGDDAYFSGLRNGMRWVLSLIDGKEPTYEQSAQPERDIPRKAIKEINKSCGIPCRQAVCPNCNSYLNPILFIWPDKRRTVTFCEYCGQAIGWEGWENDEID